MPVADLAALAGEPLGDFIAEALIEQKGSAAVTTPVLAYHLALYVGPDQILPLTSILGAIGGAIMIFWRQVVGVFRRIGGIFKRS